MREKKFLFLIFTILFLTLSCKKNKGTPHPHMLMLPDMKSIVLGRIDSGNEPYKTKYTNIVLTAENEYKPGDPLVWNPSDEEYNARIAQANAFLAYLYNDESRARKAIDVLTKIRTDFETNQQYDVNIRIPGVVIKYINALDLLQGTPLITESEVNEIKSLIIELVDKFFNIYVKGTMSVVHLPTQNNYNIKTASTIAYAAIAFPDAPNREEWWNFSLSELGYMFSKESNYIQEDGGVSEEPFYYGFALGSAVPVFIAYKNTYGNKTSRVSRDCTLRNPAPPWDDVVCIDGEEYEFVNPLDSELFQKTLDWTIKLRLPSGDRPPIGDGYFNATGVMSVLSGILNNPVYAWDNKENLNSPYATFDDIYFLVYFDNQLPENEPDWSPTQFFPQSGDAVFRSNWSREALWFMLKCENGPVRMTVHDHVDDTSFQLYAFGGYLAIDTGYYKPNELDNAVTSHFENHNVVLIDNNGPPDKGLLTNFGDTDCFLENTYDGNYFDYADARTNYQNTEIVRSVLSVKNRYVVISDFLDASSSHEYRFRVHGYAGYDSGGTYSDIPLGGRWERTSAGFDLFVTTSAGPPTFEKPVYEKNLSPNVHLFENDRKVRDHQVLDAVINGEDLSFITVLYPYKIGSSIPSEMRATVTELSTPSDSSALEILNPDGKRDIAIANRTGTSVIIKSGADTIETDAKFAFLSINALKGFIARGTYLKVNEQNLIMNGTSDTFMMTED